MEPQNEPRSVRAAPSPPSEDDRGEDHHLDSSPTGSPEDSDSCLPKPSVENQAAPLPTDVLRSKIVKQVEYYFSDENLPTDKFMLQQVSKNADGYVPMGVICSFRKMKKLTRDMSVVVDALKDSSLLVVSSNGKKVKRLIPFRVPEIHDPMVCTVLVENLPEDHSVANLTRIFSEAGTIKNITIREPNDVSGSEKCTVAEKIISGRLHALVEYDTVDTAEKAVATLNNEQDWRNGLRVKLLKKANKPGLKKQAWKDAQQENSSKARASEISKNGENNHHLSAEKEQVDDSHDEEDVAALKAKNGAGAAKERNGPKGKSRGRGARQKYHSASGLGHGTKPSETSKPPPGPKMPDGTRGFALGRGRPLAASST